MVTLSDDAWRLIDYLTFKMQCVADQERYGWRLDVEKAQQHYDTLVQLQQEKVEELSKAMPKRELTKKQEKPKVTHKKDGSLSAHGERWFQLLKELKLPETTVGPVTVTVGYEDGNPGSPEQVKDWLYGLGWRPATFQYKRNKKTGDERKIPQLRYPKGHPDEGSLCDSVRVLAEKDPAIEVLQGLSVINHRAGFFKSLLSDHKDGWLKATAGGFTNTLRFKHRAPLCNIPGVDKPWGKEIRECLISSSGNSLLCGADMTSLEDTTKRHYMKPLDPDYVQEMSKEGYDPHLDLAQFAGAVTQEDIDKHTRKAVDLTPLRKKYKAANYSCIYGVGASKLARETGMGVSEAKALIDAYWERNWAIKKVSDNQQVREVNGNKWLKNPVSGFWHNLRFDKDRFSTLNQSTGVYCFDTWVAYARKQGLQIIGQFHDEVVVVCEKGDEKNVEAKLQWAIQKANDKIKLNVPLSIDVKFGESYADVH